MSAGSSDKSVERRADGPFGDMDKVSRRMIRAKRHGAKSMDFAIDISSSPSWYLHGENLGRSRRDTTRCCLPLHVRVDVGLALMHVHSHSSLQLIRLRVDCD